MVTFAQLNIWHINWAYNCHSCTFLSLVFDFETQILVLIYMNSHFQFSAMLIFIREPQTFFSMETSFSKFIPLIIYLISTNRRLAESNMFISSIHSSKYSINKHSLFLIPAYRKEAILRLAYISLLSEIRTLISTLCY